MSRNRSNFVRVMGTASAVVLSSALAMPAVAIAADTDGAELLEQALDPSDQIKVKEVETAIDKVDSSVSYADQVNETTKWKNFKEAYDKYKALPAGLQSHVSNYSKLGQALQSLQNDETQAQDFTDYMDDKAIDGTVGLNKTEEVTKAQAKFNDLGVMVDATKLDGSPLVHSGYVQRLKDAVKAIEEQQKGADEYITSAATKMNSYTSGLDLAAISAKKDQTGPNPADSAIASQAYNEHYDKAYEQLYYIENAKDTDGNDLKISAQGKNAVMSSVNQVITVANDVVAKRNKLNDAQEEVDLAQRAVDKASADTKAGKELILKDKIATRDDCKSKLEKAEKLSTLTDNQKKLYSAIDDMEKLGDAINNSPSGKASDAIDLIDPNWLVSHEGTEDESIMGLTLASDEAIVNAAAEKYNALNKTQKLQLSDTKVKYLQRAIKRIEALKESDEDHQKALAVEEKILALPALEDLTYGDKAAVEAARAAYDALTDAQKALVDEDLVKALEDAEKRIEELKPVLTAQVYRLYNNYSGEHFYTADESEKDALVAIGWVNETDEKNSWWSADETGDPVYRLYNPNADGGDHHYTMSTEEVDALVALGWKKDNDGKPVFFSADDEFGVPVYRAYNGNAEAHNHNYTASLDEQTALVKAGWTGEGIAFYGMPLLKDAE